MRPITFGDIREYCSRTDRVSICRLETLSYENYDHMELVPHDRDSLYLYGFGMIESEFTGPQGRLFAPCVEFMLSEKPREEQT